MEWILTISNLTLENELEINQVILSNLNSKINKFNCKIENLQNKVNVLENQIYKIEDDIESTEDLIEEQEDLIENLKKEIFRRNDENIVIFSVADLENNGQLLMDI
jgi:peptidoglycan hydrolase CwlO-like protein